MKVERENTYDTRCACVGVWIDGLFERCPNDRQGPDAPFCRGCEDRHPGDLKPGGVDHVTTIFDPEWIEYLSSESEQEKTT